jgi:hypothetical protein
MKGADNMFSFARVQRVEILPDKKFKLYGISFVKNSEK